MANLTNVFQYIPEVKKPEEKITDDEEYKFYECYSCGEKGKVLY